jgi:hypothetical protein
VGLGGDQVLDGEEVAFADQGNDSLVGVGAADAGELVAGFEGDADAGGAAEFGEAFEFGVTALAGEDDGIEPARTRANGFFDGMQAVKNFHGTSLPLWMRATGG